MLAIRSSTGILQSTGKRIFRDGTQTYRQMTEKHCNLETKSAKWANSVKIPHTGDTESLDVCGY